MNGSEGYPGEPRSSPSAGRLKGLTAIVTGAASGLGRQSAVTFAREGANVVLADRSTDVAKVSDEILGFGGNSCSAVVDVTDEASVSGMAELAVREFGQIDVLFANAGIPGPGSAHDLARSDWDRVIGVNLTGVWLSIRACLGPMLDAGKGSIVTTASAAGLVGVSGVFAYSAAKGGVISLTRQVAAEYGPRGIRANTICPGTVYTPLVQRTYAERSGADSSTEAAISKEIADKYPLRRMGTPEAIANAALYLASDESEWTTGAVFSIDGGLTAI